MIDWQKTIIPSVALLVLGALAWKGVVHPEALITLVVGTLLPSPAKPKEPS